jgi:hypothetical protein
MTKRKSTKGQEEFEDTKGVIRIRISKKNRQLGHCVVCSSSIYGFWLPLWYLQTLLVLLYFFFWPLCCLFFFDIRILITPLVSSNSSCPFVLFLLVIVLSVLHRLTDYDCPFGIKGQEEFEDTKGVIRIRISKKNRQHNGQKKKYKRTRRVWRYQRDNRNP